MIGLGLGSRSTHLLMRELGIAALPAEPQQEEADDEREEHGAHADDERRPPLQPRRLRAGRCRPWPPHRTINTTSLCWAGIIVIILLHYYYDYINQEGSAHGNAHRR